MNGHETRMIQIETYEIVLSWIEQGASTEQIRTWIGQNVANIRRAEAAERCAEAAEKAVGYPPFMLAGAKIAPFPVR